MTRPNITDEGPNPRFETEIEKCGLVTFGPARKEVYANIAA